MRSAIEWCTATVFLIRLIWAASEALKRQENTVQGNTTLH